MPHASRLRHATFASKIGVSSRKGSGKRPHFRKPLPEGALKGQRDTYIQVRALLAVPTGPQLAVASEAILEIDPVLLGPAQAALVGDKQAGADVFAQGELQFLFAGRDLDQIQIQRILQRPLDRPVKLRDDLPV